jgi:hypothetical protein
MYELRYEKSGLVRFLDEEKGFCKQLKRIIFQQNVWRMGKDSFCGCSIPTIFNQRWIFLKGDQMKKGGQPKKASLCLGMSKKMDR